MISKLIPLALLPWLALAPPALADEAAAPATSADASASAAEDTAAATEAEAPTTRDAEMPAFDPAEVGLPGLPQSMASAEDFETALALIDAQIAEQKGALQTAQAEAEAARAAAEAAAATGPDAEPDEQAAADTDSTPDGEAADEAGSMDADAAAETLEASAALIAAQIDVLRRLRAAVQRRATLRDRLATIAGEIEQQREQIANVETENAALEPPYLISQLDQQQAERALKRAVIDMAETRVETTMRRMSAAERHLASTLRERRAARDRLVEAEDEGASAAARQALQQDLTLARLNELLARQQLAAVTGSLELARGQEALAEAQQAVLAARMAYLETRAELPQEALEHRLAELKEAEDALYAEIDALQGAGDQAESALYQARRRLAGAEDDAALGEWVAARQAELEAARTSVDLVTSAMGNLERMRTLWEQRYAFMNDPDSIDSAALLRHVMTETSAVRAEKAALEQRLNGLRSIQLAHARRMRDPDLGEGLREAMRVRSAAHDLAERHARALLETQDALIALLQGMRYQLDDLVQEQGLSLKLLKAQETLASWWDAELIVIDDHGIRAGDLVIALAMFVVVLFAVSLIRFAARRALQRRRVKSPNAEYGDLRLALSAIAGNTNQLFVLIAAFYVAMAFSGLASPTVKDWLWTALVIAFYAQLGIWANAAMLDYFTRRRTRQEMRDPSTVTGYGLLTFFIRVGIWITVLVSLLAYFKYPVAGLVGALGVGSLAIAFAVQNILGDVFSSMAIILDKPFRVGDFIKAGEVLGTIEHIGVKTTRIRSLSGEQLVLSNSNLLNTCIHNFKQFRERRISFRIGVIYQTPRPLIEQIPDMLRESVEEQPQARFDRAHFFAFDDYALTFEVVYFVTSPDFGIYMDTQQGINLGIHRRFEAAGVDFAYPTQELIVRRGTAPVYGLASSEAG